MRTRKNYSRGSVRENDMMQVIRSLMAARGRPCSQAEIAEAMGLSKQRVGVLVRQAVERGRLTHEPGKARTLRVVE
jgi:hypothetical protein